VSDFAELGIYTILDMHQDVLWQAGENEDQGYWGVPPWIKHKVDNPDHYFPWPMINPTVWECGYFTQVKFMLCSLGVNSINAHRNIFMNLHKY